MHDLPCYANMIDYIHCIGSWENNMQKGEKEYTISNKHI